MANIKEQISDFRKSTPKSIQWLLLVAAFIVVLILLTLLFTASDKTKVIQDDDTATEISFVPSAVDFTDTPVGETKTQDIAISATNPIKVTKVSFTQGENVTGFELKQSCERLDRIENRPTKCITVTYTPEKTIANTEVNITVTWRLQNAPDGMQNTNDYHITLGATGDDNVAKIDSTPVLQPVNEPVITEPVSDPVDDTDDEYTDDTSDNDDTDFLDTTDDDISDTISNDIKLIAPSNPFADATKTPAPTVAENITAPEACSDFAIPGYGTSGNQIGWIKPERGAYYFHPFSDKDCSTPTGIYNPDNGIITDISGNGKRIGTDAEHVGNSVITNGTLPKLSNPATTKPSVKAAYWNESMVQPQSMGQPSAADFANRIQLKTPDIIPETYLGSGDNSVISTRAFDRQFILRQYKPIPATIVSEVRADPSLYNDSQEIQLPVRATVDRNVYADDGRNVILPTGTLMLGYVTGTLPGPYTAIGRMQIKWYQFILPNGVEFNFSGGNDPISGDSQGRVGVPGHGSTDYLEQFVMPMLTAIVPAAVNMIAPVADKFVNQIDLDNNTVVQSGTMRSSELAKNEIITAWNQVANKLLVDMMDNTTPPFSIAAGTRITVYSPADLIVSCGENTGPNAGKKCALGYGPEKRGGPGPAPTPNYDDGSWVGQARSFNWAQYCNDYDEGKGEFTPGTAKKIVEAGLDYSSVLFYCQSRQYKAINNAKQEAYYQDQQQQFQTNYQKGTQNYNEQVLGLKYDDNNAIINPFAKPAAAPVQEEQPATIGCLDGTKPDANGCCTGETLTDMGADGFNCCPDAGGDCFPPIL